MALSHNHYCKFCDTMATCNVSRCFYPHDVSSVHECDERSYFRRRMAEALNSVCPVCKREHCNRRHSGEDSHAQGSSFPTIGRRLVLPVCLQDCEDYLEYGYCEHVAERLKPIAGNPVIYNGKGHSEQCLCRKCRQAWFREHEVVVT